MTAPFAVDDNKARISRNVDKMLAHGAPESEVEQYIQSEGLKPVSGEVPVEEAPKKPADTGYGPVDAAANGMLGGFGGEIAAGLRSHAPQWMLGPEARGKTGTYSQELAKENEGERQYREAHPVANFGAEALGMALPALATGGANLAERVGIKSALGQAVANQGALGALYGAGNAGEGHRTEGAAYGGAVGGVLGGGTHLGLKALQAVSEAVPGVNTVGRKLGMLRTPQELGDKLALKRIGEDQMTPQAIKADVLARTNPKPEIMLDYGGENLTGLGKNVVNAPGASRREFGELVANRSADAPGRISQDLNATGMTPIDKFKTADALIASKKANAKPLYDAALKGNTINDPHINAFLETKEGRAAFEIAKDMRRKEAEAVSFAPGGMPVTPQDYALPNVLDADGKLINLPDDQTLHHMKLALDKMVKFGYVEPGGTASQVNRLDKGVAVNFRKHIGQLIPGYDKAAGQYSTDQGLQDAFESGSNFLKEDAAKSANDVAAMSPGEKDLYRLGAGAGIRRSADVAPDGTDIAKRVFGSPEKRNQIAAAVDDPAAFQGLSQEMGRERRMAVVNRLQTGSQTAPMAMEGADAAKSLGVIRQLVTGHPFNALGSLIDKASMPQEVRDAVGTRLLAGKGGRQELLSALDALTDAQKLRLSKSGALASLIAAMSGSAAGSAAR